MPTDSKEIVPVSPWAPMSDTYKTALAKMAKPDLSIEVIVPDEIAPGEIWKNIEIVCRGLRRTQANAQAFIAVLGRLLMIARENPDSYKEKGYETYEDLLGGIEKQFGVSRSTCYNARLLVERWGSVIPTIGDFDAVGPQKFRIINRIVAKGDEKKKSSMALLAQAKVMTLEEFKAHLDKKGVLSSDESHGFTIEIPTTRAISREWKAFCNNPEIQAWVGTDNPGGILESLMSECKNEWLVRGREKLTEKAEAEAAAPEPAPVEA